MDIDFTPEQLPVVQQAIERGRIRRPEEAAEEALSWWVERERKAFPRKAEDNHDQNRAAAAAARMLFQRERHILPFGVTIRDFTDEGRD